jgi:hypothetical protein
MAVDPEFLRQQYASLSDVALLAIDRDGLVAIAQEIYDEELSQRDVKARFPLRREDPAAQKLRVSREQSADCEEPDWLEEAVEVFSVSEFQGGTSSQEAVQARDVLEAAGVPCYLDSADMPEQKSVTPPCTLWRLLVPGSYNMHATSILDRDIFNADFEANWKAHLEVLSDDELAAVNPQDAFCGLFDQVERVLNAYDAELARRGLK